MVEEYSDAYGFRFLIDACGLITGLANGEADQGVLALWMAAHYFRRQSNHRGSGERVSREGFPSYR